MERKWIPIKGGTDLAYGVSTKDTNIISKSIGEKAAVNLSIDCPAYRCSVEDFKISSHPVSLGEFKIFWNSDDRSRMITSSESDELFWSDVFNYSGVNLNGPALGMTHDEAKGFAKCSTSRVPYQHELEHILRGSFQGGVIRELPYHCSLSSYDFWNVYTWTHSIQMKYLDVIADGVFGLFNFAYVLAEIEPKYQSIIDSADVIKPLGPLERFLHAGSYLRFPAWRFYVGSDRVFPLHPAALWLVSI
jgi:hypothetical protein